MAEGGGILLVEDNPYDLELTMHAFAKNRLANALHVVRDGKEALDVLFGDAAASLPLVILLDLKLPYVDGLEVLRRIKTDERTCKIPVVVLTASREESDVIESYKLGANSYIVKPVDFDKFSEAVRLVGMYWMLLNEPPVGNGHG